MEKPAGKSRSGATPNTVKHNLLVRIARLYYLCHMTHQEIAVREGMSRIKVGRLLKEAVSRGIVEFKIQDPMMHDLELEEALQKTFALETAIITPTPPSEQDMYEILGRFGADFLTGRLKNGLNIGIGWGRTLNGMLPYLGKSACRGMKVISLTGGLSANQVQPNPYDVASALGQRLGATPWYPVVPVIVESEQSRELLLRETRVREIMELWQTIDIALMSIGVIASNAAFYRFFPDPAQEAKRVKDLGAVGDLLAIPFDIDGRLVDAGFLKRMIVIQTEDLKRVPVVMGISGGQQKAKAILGALRTGLLTALITDENTAEQILKAAEE